MKVIGLTGGIGSGKSTVARLLADLGAAVIDADRVGHEVYQPRTDGWQQIRDEFGDDVIAADGSIDRKRLGGIVFADPQALARLNRIVHPLIRSAVAERVAALRGAGDAPAIVIEAAVMIEAGWDDWVDELWVVIAGSDPVRDRLVRDRAMAPDQIAARIRAQLSDDERRSRADVVIDNSGSLEQLEARVRQEWARVTRD